MNSSNTKLDINNMKSEVNEKKENSPSRQQKQKNEKKDDEEFLMELNKPTFLKFKKWDELVVDETYLIENMERTQAKYGEAIITTLLYEDDRFKIYLPNRYVKILSDSDMKRIVESKVYKIKYKGGKYHDLVFCK